MRFTEEQIFHRFRHKGTVMRFTEEQIERFVEQAVNVADRSFMAGKMTQAEYDARMKRISQWADDRYSER